MNKAATGESATPRHEATVVMLDPGIPPADPSAASGCPAQSISDQLGRILDSTDFDASERNRRFLRYVVGEVLAGRGSRIKAYSIATTVFGRDSSFDPQTDAIVRIEARRLRRSLEHYYLTAGRNDPILISIPKGSYCASFDERDAGGEVAQSPGECPLPTARSRGPSILVAYFDTDDARQDLIRSARSFTRHLVVSLTRFTALCVYGPDPAYGGAARKDTAGRDDIDYVLTGGMTISGDRVGVEALLVDARSGRNVWAGSFEWPAEPNTFGAGRDDVVNEIAGTLAQPFGVIFGDRPHETASSPQESVALFYHYCHSSTGELRERVRSLLEDAIVAAPEYAEAFACLALTYADLQQDGTDSANGDADPLEHIMMLAWRAVELAPHSSRAHQALSVAHWLAGDPSASIEALKTAESLNPNDMVIVAELGLRYAMLAQWDRAVPILEEAYARCPLLPRKYRLGLALDHLAHSRHELAQAEVRKIGAPTFLGQVIETVAAIQLGAEDGNMRGFPGRSLLRGLRKQCVGPDVTRLILTGLRPDPKGRFGLTVHEIEARFGQGN